MSTVIKSVSEKSYEKELLQAAWEVDRKNRVVGVNGDLVPVSVLSQAEWHGALPTIVLSGNIMPGDKLRPVSILTDDGVLAKNLYRKYPFLEDLDMGNLLLAGGSVLSLVSQQRWPTDLDFFVYGLTGEAEATDRAVRLIEEIRKFNTEHPKTKRSWLGDSNKVVRTPGCITFWAGSTKVQVILRLYNTLSEVLHGFDLACCAVGFTVQNEEPCFLTTTLGGFCIQRGIVLVDTDKKSTSFEYRLAKYFCRGLSLVVPFLDVSSVKTTHPFVLGGRLYFKTPIVIRGMFVGVAGHKDLRCTAKSDYLDADPVAIDWINLKTILAAEKQGDEWKVKNCLGVSIEGTAPLDRLVKVDGTKVMENIRKIYTHMANTHRKKQKIETQHGLLAWVPGTNSNDMHEQLVAERLEHVSVVLRSLQSQGFLDVIQWRTENPGGQGPLTSSFNPVACTPQEWYGEYYKEL